jgi:hypothetical protein
MANKYMNKKQVEIEFKENILPNISKKDKPAIRMAWNDFTDQLCKDGSISYKQYMTWDHPKFCK